MNLRGSFDIPVGTIVLAEGEFGRPGGKTANGVVMHSEIFDVQAIVDSKSMGETPADVLENPNAPDIPIVASVEEAIDVVAEPSVFVIGVAPAGGQLPDDWVEDIETAIKAGCDVVSGLHVFLGDDDHWSALANDHGVRIFDVRKPPEEDTLRVADGSVDSVDAPVVLTMGTDCAIGKRTTTFELYTAAREAGRNAAWVASGQTGIMVGAHRGVVVDRVPADFTAGVVEDLIKDVASDFDLIFVEGQAALTHRAYSGVTLSILHGSWPDAVVLANDPERQERTHFEQFTVDGVAKERRLIEDLSDATVAGISTWGEPSKEQERHDLPASNVYHEGGASALLAAIDAALKGETE